jgi:hypothetical protein
MTLHNFRGRFASTIQHLKKLKKIKSISHIICKYTYLRRKFHSWTQKTHKLLHRCHVVKHSTKNYLNKICQLFVQLLSPPSNAFWDQNARISNLCTNFLTCPVNIRLPSMFRLITHVFYHVILNIIIKVFSLMTLKIICNITLPHGGILDVLCDRYFCRYFASLRWIRSCSVELLCPTCW